MWTRRWIRMLALTFIAVMIAASLALRLTAVNGIDYCGNSLFPDFAQLYVSGQHILHNQADTLYDEEPFYRDVNRVLNAESSAGFYPVYPPFAAVLAAPWALMSYPVAAWSHALLCILVACYLARDMARYFFGDSDDASVAMLLFLAFLPLWRVWLFGQNGIWALAILWGSWRLWVSGRGLASGLLLSLGLFKPQLFVGAWLWAILWGNRRLRLGLILGVAAGVVVPVLSGGWSIWTQWLDAARHTTDLADRVDWMTSLPHAWKLADGERFLGVAWIYAVMLAGGVVWGVVLLQLRWKNASPTFALYLALFGSWILTPRLYVYDWILAWPLLLAAWKYGTHRTRLVLAWGGLVFWIHDLFAMLHVPILAMLGVAAFVWLLVRVHRLAAEGDGGGFRGNVHS